MSFNINGNDTDKPAESAKVSSSDSDAGSHTDGPTPRVKYSRTYTVVGEHTKEILRLRQNIDPEEWQLKEDNKVDKITQPTQIKNLFTSGTNVSSEEEKIQIAHLEESRPNKWLTLSLTIALHVCVLINFFMSWYDSARILLKSAKIYLWLMESPHNCLETVSPNLDWRDHTMNIIHSLLACSALFVNSQSSSTLCLVWTGSQAAHSFFRIFQYFYKLKFEKQTFIIRNWKGLAYLGGIITLDAVCVLILIQKYCDLTDRSKTVEKYSDTTEKSLNDKIIYRNKMAFLQRKSILRDVITSQTFAIIDKIGKHIKHGRPIDAIRLNKEINAAKLAITDCETADTHNIVYMVKRAYANRLKELGNQRHGME